MKYNLNGKNINDFLDRFESLDGAVIREFHYYPNNKNASSKVELILMAFDTSLLGEEPYSNSLLIKVTFIGDIEFKISESGGGSNVAINEAVTCFHFNEMLYLNFDSLSSKDWSSDSWTIDEIRRSKFYIGSKRIEWEELEKQSSGTSTN